jgi:hypothetical protein
LNERDRRARELKDIEILNKQMADLDKVDTTQEALRAGDQRSFMRACDERAPQARTAITSTPKALSARPSARWTKFNKWGSLCMLRHPRLGSNVLQCVKDVPIEVWLKIFSLAGSRYAQGTEEWEDDRSKERLLGNISWSQYHACLGNKPMKNLTPIEHCMYLNYLHKVGDAVLP